MAGGGVVTVRVPESVPRLGLGGVKWWHEWGGNG